MRVHLSRVAAVVIATGALGGLAACGGDDEGEAAQRERTLRFTDREGTMATSVDAAPRTLDQEEITPGDQVVVTRHLLDGSGDRAGIVHSVCTVTDGKDEAATQTCQGMFELADGRIAFAKTAKLSEPAPPPIPVTGGTGAYRGATGEIVSSADGTVEVKLLVP